MLKQHWRRNMAGKTQDYIEFLARSGWSPTQIQNQLSDNMKKGARERHKPDDKHDHIPDHIPDIRTIRDMVGVIKSSDTSGRWSMVDCEPEDARLVLDVLAGCMAHHSNMIGYNNYFTEAQAEWVIKLSKATAGAPARIIATLVHLYMTRVAKGIVDMTDLDGYLAFTPWKNSKCLRLYKSIVIRRYLPMVPGWPILVGEVSKKEHFDPRFTGSDEAIRAFEKDVYERSTRGTDSSDFTANIYDIHPDDVKDIVRKYEEGVTQ